MKHIRSRPQRWWHRRSRLNALASGTAHADAAIGEDSTVLTQLELADVHSAAVACRAVEHRYNSRVAKLLSRLARTADMLARVIAMTNRRAADHAQLSGTVAQIDQALAQDGLHLRSQRRMGRKVRCIAIGGLGVLDITAYRSAMELVFNTSDANAFGIVESVLLSMLSMGMVIAAAFCGASIRHYLDGKAYAESQLEGAITTKAARREALTVGVPAGLIAVAAMIAGASLRLQVMQAVGTAPITTSTATAVTIISGLALLGAFFIELKWASDLLDKRDQLHRSEHQARRRLEAAERSAQDIQKKHRTTIEAVLHEWGVHQPTWEAQIDACAERIHAVRGRQTGVFTLVGASVRPVVADLVALGDARLNVDAIVRDRKLSFETIIAEPRSPISTAVSGDAKSTTTVLTVPDDARELDSVIEELHDHAT